jgi:hypothetical protein
MPRRRANICRDRARRQPAARLHDGERGSPVGKNLPPIEGGDEIYVPTGAPAARRGPNPQPDLRRLRQ